MNKIYKAHINELSGQVQTVREHSEQTAALCGEFAIPVLRDFMRALGVLHDAGKLQDSFQRRIDGENIRVEHSVCGAQIAQRQYPGAMGLMMEYCIAGHHSGIPDGGFANDTPDMSTLCARLKRDMEDYSAYRTELPMIQPDMRQFAQFLMQDCDRDVERLVDKFAFMTRYAFSCLTDADSLDTASFCTGSSLEGVLKTDFSACLEKADAQLKSFVCRTRLQRSRAFLQRQVFDKTGEDAEIYLMNMPTGSGKTLCSVKFALERAIRKGRKRIIYIIPYNSIIDQTAEVFGELFGADAQILRHQSTFSYEDGADESEDYRNALKSAAENWDAPFIITTAVQFFESVYANKRGKLRKLHNMADSILIFDEAHLMPQDYLQPCLRSISYITRYLNSEAVFLTATMPDFQELMKQYALPDSRMIQLITDTAVFKEFQKCQYIYTGKMTAEALLEKGAACPSSLFIVNSRATARILYQKCSGKKYHLSTYMTSYDRKSVIAEIRQELIRLETDFPDGTGVPQERRITIISTSLIEAGVDLDVHTVFRELAGLDSILQAGGRCNREGKREQAQVYIFELEDGTTNPAMDERGGIVRGMLQRYPDISCQESIAEYYQRLFFLKKQDISKHTITQECKDIASIPFKTYAESFELISSRTVSVVVARDERSRELVKSLRYTGTGAARQLQLYTASVYQWELDDLIRQHVVEDYGTGMYCLTNPDYYHGDTGILFEAEDYWI